MAAYPNPYRSIVGLGLAALAAAAPAAQSMPSPDPSIQHRGENGEMLALTPRALSLVATYTSDASANLSGGLETGGAYLQRIGLIADTDLDAVLGWQGATAHASVHWIAGTGLSARRVGNILTVSGIEAAPALRLFNLWVEQKLGSDATLRVGQFTAAQEFAISPTANLFINSTFGWPASFATDLPSGGPAYPLAAPGVRLAVSTDHRTQFRLGIFSGDPAGPGTGDPQRRDRNGMNGFRLTGGPFIIAEMMRTAGGQDPAWRVSIGSWWHAHRFRKLGSAIATTPPDVAGNQAVYAVADARLWQSSSHVVRGFVRASASAPDRNVIDLYGDAGVTISAPLTARPDDVAGLGIAFARISPRLRTEVAKSAMYPAVVPTHEMVVEATYQAQLAPMLFVQPHVQLVRNPAAALLAERPASGRPLGSAIVIGLRMAFRY